MITMLALPSSGLAVYFSPTVVTRMGREESKLRPTVTQMSLSTCKSRDEHRQAESHKPYS